MRELVCASRYIKGDGGRIMDIALDFADSDTASQKERMESMVGVLEDVDWDRRRDVAILDTCSTRLVRATLFG